jgi:hypothetical protein
VCFQDPRHGREIFARQVDVGRQALFLGVTT